MSETPSDQLSIVDLEYGGIERLLPMGEMDPVDTS